MLCSAAADLRLNRIMGGSFEPSVEPKVGRRTVGRMQKTQRAVVECVSGTTLHASSSGSPSIAGALPSAEGSGDSTLSFLAFWIIFDVRSFSGGGLIQPSHIV